jgi:hypothetical protein
MDKKESSFMNMHFTSNNVKETESESNSSNTDFDDEIQELSSDLEFTQTHHEKIVNSTLIC